MIGSLERTLEISTSGASVFDHASCFAAICFTRSGCSEAMLFCSLGSSFELGTQLILASNRSYIDEKTLTTIEGKLEEFQKMTMGFQNTL